MICFIPAVFHFAFAAHVNTAPKFILVDFFMSTVCFNLTSTISPRSSPISLNKFKKAAGYFLLSESEAQPSFCCSLFFHTESYYYTSLIVVLHFVKKAILKIYITSLPAPLMRCEWSSRARGRRFGWWRLERKLAELRQEVGRDQTGSVRSLNRK